VKRKRAQRAPEHPIVEHLVDLLPLVAALLGLAVIVYLAT
jgi:hypothetical protein